MYLESINPYDEIRLARYKCSSLKQLSTQLDEAQIAQQNWKQTSLATRKSIIRKFAKLLEQNLDELATTATLEMGKPLAQARIEVQKCATSCRYYVDNIDAILSTEKEQLNEGISYIHYSPLGVVLSIMPWNFPYWQVIRNLSPILLGGNAYALKHASNVYGCATKIAELLAEAGLPKGVFTLLYAKGDQAEALIEHKAVAAISFTGSTAIGKRVASAAGKVIKKCVLELGGNDGYGILADANIIEAVKTCSYSRFINNGQSCLAAKRFIVNKNVYHKFKELLLDFLSNLKIGNPMELDTILGPLARIDLRDELAMQVQQSVKKGAILSNKREVPKRGAFYPPVLLENVLPGMVAYSEELFGPVSTMIKGKDDNDVIRIINDTSYGLGAAIFTKSNKRAEQILTTQLEAGNCFANDFCRSIPNRPFGGIKESGYGREMGSFGVYEFMNTKSIFLSKK